MNHSIKMAFIKPSAHWLIFLSVFPLTLAHTAIGSDSTAKKCSHVESAVFGDEANLSVSGCGLRNETAGPQHPWRVKFYLSTGKYQHGVLISREIAVTYFNANDSAEDFTYALLGRCFDDREENADCSRHGSQGFKAQVRDRVAMGIANEVGHEYWLIFIEAVPQWNQWIRPLCLFNRDAERDLATDEVYFSYWMQEDVLVKRKLLPLSECGFENDREMCGNQICSEETNGFFLVNLHEGRFFLRALWNSTIVHEDTMNDLFHDLLGSMQKIADESKGEISMRRRSEN